jgi:hypothetical protein
MRHRHRHPRFQGRRRGDHARRGDAMETGERTTTRVQLGNAAPGDGAAAAPMKERPRPRLCRGHPQRAACASSALVQGARAGREFSLKRANGETVAYKVNTFTVSLSEPQSHGPIAQLARF